jgi:4-diphosphocytidyl-2-C-methyl-D-erythritol kinase
VRVRAWAKVNLFLDVGPARPDGFHEVDTLLVPIDLCDTVLLSPNAHGHVTLTVTGAPDSVPDGDENLAVRAAHLLRGGDSSCGVDIVLHKEIPVGAGLGGGSSDAAAVLRGLRDVWRLDHTDEELARTGAQLGSDVPFFLAAGAARCTGRGEIVERLSVRGEAHFVLAFGEPLSTRDVYARFDEVADPGSRQADPAAALRELLDGNTIDLDAVGTSRRWNALEAAAFSLVPELRKAGRELAACGALRPRMSGSGSCIFGAARSRADAERIARRAAERGLRARASSAMPVEVERPPVDRC